MRAAPGRSSRGVALRDGERVTPLELFFDLVFVLAITQCTALMAADPSWWGLGPGPRGVGPAVVGVGGLRLAHGMKLTLGHVDEPLRWEGAVALVGGSALYIAAQVLFKRRSLGTFGIQRVVTAIVLLALIVPAHSIDAIVTLAAVAVVLWALIAFEGVRYAATRDRLGHTPERQPVGNPVHDERPVGRAN